MEQILPGQVRLTTQIERCPPLAFAVLPLLKRGGVTPGRYIIDPGIVASSPGDAMTGESTTVIVQRQPGQTGRRRTGRRGRAFPAGRGEAVRLHQLCATILHRGYPQLTRPPLNVQSDEMLSAVVARLLKALREARPATGAVFLLAGQHTRRELNHLARRLDHRPGAVELVSPSAIVRFSLHS